MIISTFISEFKNRVSKGISNFGFVFMSKLSEDIVRNSDLSNFLLSDNSKGLGKRFLKILKVILDFSIQELFIALKSRVGYYLKENLSILRLNQQGGDFMLSRLISRFVSRLVSRFVFTSFRINGCLRINRCLRGIWLWCFNYSYSISLLSNWGVGRVFTKINNCVSS